MADELKTSFVIVDEATETLSAIGLASKKLQKELEAAAAANKKAGGALPTAPTKPEKVKTAEEERFAADREELRLQRNRVRNVRLQMDRQRIASGIVSSSSALVGGANVQYISNASHAAEALQGLGFQLTEMGGKTGQAGAVMAKLSGSAVAAIGALAVGWQIGTFLDELPKTLLGWRSMSDALAGVDPKAIARANEAYAKSLGYRSASEYAAVVAVGKTMTAEKSTRLELERFATRLPAVPLNSTAQSLDVFNAEVMRIARQLAAASGIGLEEAVAKVKQASESGLQTVLQKTQHELAMNRAYDEQLKNMEALKLNPTAEAEAEYVQNLRWGAIRIAERTASDESMIPIIAAELDQKLRAKGSLDNVMESMAEHDAQEKKLSVELKNYQKYIRSMSTKEVKLAGGLEALQRRGAEFIYHQIGATDPKMAETIRGRLKEQMLKTAKVNFDFSRSKFDIRQNFAEGFDPDRIAVAFVNDLAGQADARLSSQGRTTGR